MLDELKINGKKVEKLRKEKGWSQNELGRRVGLLQAGVNAIEKEYRCPSGALRSTSIEKFAKLCSVLETSADYLLDFTEEDNPLYTRLYERALNDVHSKLYERALNDVHSKYVQSITKALNLAHA